MDSPVDELEIEDTIFLSEVKVAELRRSGVERAMTVASSLERMLQSLRLAVGRDPDHASREGEASRLHRRLQAALRSADLLATEEVPQSQRPTVPPQPGERPAEVWEKAKPVSERITLPPPRAISEIMAKVGVEDAPAPSEATELRPVKSA